MARSKAERFAYQYHSKARVEFVAALPCCACGRRDEPSENHHVWGEGMGRKGPYVAIVPLCNRCHYRYHTIGKLSMLQAVKLRLLGRDYRDRYDSSVSYDQWDDLAAAVEEMWQENEGDFTH